MTKSGASLGLARMIAVIRLLRGSPPFGKALNASAKTELGVTTCGAGGVMSACAGLSGICATSMATEVVIAIKERIDSLPHLPQQPPCRPRFQSASDSQIAVARIRKPVARRTHPLLRLDPGQ